MNDKNDRHLSTSVEIPTSPTFPFGDIVQSLKQWFFNHVQLARGQVLRNVALKSRT